LVISIISADEGSRTYSRFLLRNDRQKHFFSNLLEDAEKLGTTVSKEKPMETKGIVITLTILLLTSCYSFAGGSSCSLAKVSGNYGYTTSGFVLAPSGVFVPAAAAGRIVFDAQGNVSGTQTRVVAGSALAETYSGTYTVDADCTGDFTVVVQPDTRASSVHLVWTGNAKGISAVFTTPGFVLTATANRISPAD
jgi:hypothetical protein